MLCWAEIQSWNRDKHVEEEDMWLHQHTLDRDKLGKPAKKRKNVKRKTSMQGK